MHSLPPLALPGATYEIAYAEQDLIEKLDSLPQRDLVDRFEAALNTHEPELLLIPAVRSWLYKRLTAGMVVTTTTTSYRR